MVHLVFLLLASRAACTCDLSICLAHSAALSDRWYRCGRRSVVLESHLFPAGTIVARAANDLSFRRMFAPK